MDRTDLQAFGEGTVIIKEGVTEPRMYKIVSGMVGLYFDYGKDSEYLIGVLSDGRCFGETGLLTGKPETFTVVAESDVLLLEVSAENFKDFITEEPDNAVAIMKKFASTVVTMGANVNMLKEELLKDISDRNETQRIDSINRSIMKYRVAGMQGSPYFSKLG